MDYIELAQKAGIERETAIYVYRRLDGGYYIKLYYAKTPILQAIKDWPEHYMKKIKKYGAKLSSPGYNEALQLLITLDAFAIIGASYALLGLPLDADRVYREVDLIYKYIQESSISEFTGVYPTETEIDFRLDFTPFIKDIVSKREIDSKIDLLKVFQEVAYESSFVEELKRKTSWIRVISKENILKALSLSGSLDNFLTSIQDIVFLIAAERTLYFDKNVITYSISDTLRKIMDEGKKALSNIVENEYENEIIRIIDVVRKSSNYL